MSEQNDGLKVGTCDGCRDMQRTMPGYCCVVCALGLTNDSVKKDPATGTVVIDLSDPGHPFWKGVYHGKA